MGDNKKWFKVWTSITTDPTFLSLDFEDIGRWLLLGAMTAQHGINGSLTIPKKSLSYLFRCDNGDAEKMITKLPNIKCHFDNAMCTVSFLHWSKYQMDSTGYERLKRHRNRQMITIQDKTKTKTKTKTKNIEKNISDKEQKFESFWEKYPSRNGKKLLKADAKIFFLKEIKDEDIPLILQAVGNYAVSKAATDGFAKDAIRFLRKDFWRDWVEPEKRHQQSGVSLRCVYDNNKTCYKDCKDCKAFER